MQAPRLKRGLLGYTPRSVRLVLADRDRLLLRAERGVRSAEAGAAELASEVRALLEELDRQTGRVREAEDRNERQEDLLDLLRRELGSARRAFLRQIERTWSAESAIDELTAELWSARADLALARRQLAGAEPVPSTIVLPDLDGQGANGTRHEPQGALRPR